MAETEGDIVTLDAQNVGELSGGPYSGSYELRTRVDSLGRPRLVTSRGLIPWCYAVNLAAKQVPKVAYADLYMTIDGATREMANVRGDVGLVPGRNDRLSGATLSGWSVTKEGSDNQENFRPIAEFKSNDVSGYESSEWDGTIFTSQVGDSALREVGKAAYAKLVSLGEQALGLVNPGASETISLRADRRRVEGLLRVPTTSIEGLLSFVYRCYVLSARSGNASESNQRSIWVSLRFFANDTSPVAFCYLPAIAESFSFRPRLTYTDTWPPEYETDAYRAVLPSFRVWFDLYHVYLEGKNRFSQSMRMQRIKSYEWGTASSTHIAGETFGANTIIEVNGDFYRGKDRFVAIRPRLEPVLPTADSFFGNHETVVYDTAKGYEDLRLRGYQYSPEIHTELPYRFEMAYIGPN